MNANSDVVDAEMLDGYGAIRNTWIQGTPPRSPSRSRQQWWPPLAADIQRTGTPRIPPTTSTATAERLRDVVPLLNHISWNAANKPASPFDDNGIGRIDFADVAWLLNNMTIHLLPRTQENAGRTIVDDELLPDEKQEPGSEPVQGESRRIRD